MDKLKAHKLLLGCSLVLMVVFGIILICDYVSKSSPKPWGWVGMAAMALAAVSQLMVIRDIKKHE